MMILLFLDLSRLKTIYGLLILKDKLAYANSLQCLILSYCCLCSLMNVNVFKPLFSSFYVH